MVFVLVQIQKTVKTKMSLKYTHTHTSMYINRIEQNFTNGYIYKTNTQNKTQDIQTCPLSPTMSLQLTSFQSNPYQIV